MRALVVLCALVGSTACDPVFEVCARVTRCSDGEPLVGVRVAFRYDDGALLSGEEVYTDPDGRACTSAMGSTSPPDRYFVDLDKPGYAASRTEIRGSESNASVCLAEAVAPACTPDASEPCTCTGGGAGTRICTADGSGFGDCGGCGPAVDAAGD